jgi:type II secretory pathway component GspD/PulD (secretin)
MKTKNYPYLFLLFLSMCAAAITSFVMAEQTPLAVEGPTQLAQVAMAPPATLPVGIEGKISLDLRNIDVVDALKFFSTRVGMNIITSKSVAGRVTLMVENALVKDVFDIMLRSNNLAYDKQGEIYNVMTQEEYKVLYGKSFSDVRKVRVFHLQYSIPEQAFSMLDLLKSDNGRVLVDPETGNVLIMDSEEKIATIEKALGDFENKNTIKIFKLNYAKAKDVEDALKHQLDSKKVGIIKADERGNQIIVQTLPDRMDQIESLVSELDQKTKEIIIDVNIVNIKLSNERGVGVEWEGLFDMGRQMGMSYLGSTPFSAVQASNDVWRSRNQVWQDVGNVGSYPFSGTTTNYSGNSQRIATEEMHLGVVGKHDFDVIFKYLQTIGKTKIVSNPKLVVVNNQEAKIHVGQKEAYVTTATTTGSSTSTVSETVNFVDVGVIITVVPSINNEGFVTFKIKAEISSVIDTLITPTSNKIPIIDTSLAETTVMVKDGSTIIIGGLRKDQKVESTRQTPFLGRIPIIGNLFSVKSTEDDRSELLIILTPRLISGEVLVSSAEREVGKGEFKPLKDYLDLKGTEISSIPSSVFIPEKGKGLELKGQRLLKKR